MINAKSYLIFLVCFSVIFFSCAKKKSNEKSNFSKGINAAYSPRKDAEIQKYNLEIKKQRAKKRTPCDTLSLEEFIFNNYPEGTYLINFDKTLTYNIPKPAVIYYKDDYIFAVIIKSKPGERLVEPKNVVGYDQSLINLDSTKLGTAFFYLTLFKCKKNNFTKVWETPIPSHGGFNWFEMKKWDYNGTPYVKIEFHFAQGIGHIDYNYFLIDGINSKPHLLMTYKGINFERTLANVNNDNYPDYYEHIFHDLGNKVYSKDSVAFVWNKKDSLYVNIRNKKQTRKY